MQIGENNLRESVETIWSSMLGLEVQPGTITFSHHRHPDALTGCVQITGRWQGAVTLDCPPILAQRAAAIMFDVPPREATRELIHDALGEITNIIGGNLKAYLPEPCCLSMPAVTQGSDYFFPVDDKVVVAKLTFTCQNSMFQVTVYKGRC